MVTCGRERALDPKDVEDLLHNRAWVAKIRKAISRYYLNPKTRLEDDPDDVFADVIVKMLKRDELGRDFVERWDRARATFGTYLFRMVNNCCIHKYKHRTCEAGLRLGSAYRLAQGDARDDNGVRLPGYIGEEELPDTRPWDPTPMLALKEAAAKLRANSRPSGWVEVRLDGVLRVRLSGGSYREEFEAREVPAVLVGTRWQRDAASMLQLLAMGFEGWEIASLWGVSTNSVYGLSKKLRAHRPTQEALRPML